MRLLSSSRSSRRSASFPLVLAACAVAVTPACKSARERAEEQARANAVAQVRFVDGGLAMTTEAGTFAFGAGSKIPDDFPKTVPIYPGSHVNMAASSPGAQGKPAWSLSLDTEDPAANVAAYCKAHMPGFTLASDLAMGDTQMQVWQSPALDVTYMIASNAGSPTAITMTVSSK
jgi:hypothetical protein